MKHSWPTLYAKSKQDKYKLWQIRVVGNEIVTTYGLEGCKMQTNRKLVHKGKNIGKKNETTPEQQAYSIADAKWLSQQKRNGYAQSKAELKKRVDYYPMLAATYVPGKTKLLPYYLAQPKLNGIRLIAVKDNNKVTLLTRKGKDVTDIHQELARELAKDMVNGHCFDGEIYRHGWSFERIAQAFKKDRSLVWRKELLKAVKKREWETAREIVERKDDTQKLEYHIYDFMSSKDFIAEDRNNILACYSFNSRRLVRVDTFCIGDRKNNVIHAQLKAIHDIFVKNGYEGAIYRDPDAKYLWGHRGKRLLKHKEMIDAEFRIIGYTCGTGNDEGAIIFKCRVRKQNGRGYNYFTCRPDGKIEKRRAMYAKGWTYIGKMLTVSFQAWSDDGVPIFPVGQIVRDYEG